MPSDGIRGRRFALCRHAILRLNSPTVLSGETGVPVYAGTSLFGGVTPLSHKIGEPPPQKKRFFPAWGCHFSTTVHPLSITSWADFRIPFWLGDLRRGHKRNLADRGCACLTGLSLCRPSTGLVLLCIALVMARTLQFGGPLVPHKAYFPK